MYTDNNNQKYKLEGNKAIIQRNMKSVKIEIFPTITVNDKEYEVVFPDDCNKLFANIDLKEFTLHKLLHPTTNINYMQYMFCSCTKLKELDLTNLDTDNVVNMELMFDDCKRLKHLNVSNFNTEKVIDMQYMFGRCARLTKLDLSSFNMNNVRYLSSMFDDCIRLTQIGLSNKYIYNKRLAQHKIWSCGSMNFMSAHQLNKKLNEVIETAKKLNIEIDNKVINYKKIMRYNRFIIISAIVSNAKTYLDVYDVNCNNSYVK